MGKAGKTASPPAGAVKGPAVNSGAGGSTLVEVLLAALLLTTLILAGASFLYQSRTTVGVQRNRRMAIAFASSRLEDLRASRYGEITPQFGERDFIARNGTNWVHSESDPGEVARINGIGMPTATVVEYLDIEKDGNSRDAVRIRTSVNYRLGTDARVEFETIRSP
jgi:hypothetical protein